jgi:hypothetical protein
MTCSNTNPATAQAFALTLAGIAAASGPIIYRHLTPFAAAIFPMASASVRMGRARALLKEAERSRMRDRELAERDALAMRFIAENRATHDLIAAPSPEERKLRRSLTARTREAETARLNAEIPLSLEARRVIANFRYHAETVRQRDENVFWPESDAWCRGRELPPLNDKGHVPGMDPTGRVLALIGNRLVYVRRTRLFASSRSATRMGSPPRAKNTRPKLSA